MKKKGEEGFQMYYSALFKERWTELEWALNKPVIQVARVNAFADAGLQGRNAEELKARTFAHQNAYLLPANSEMQPQRDEAGLLDFYIMDPASIFPAVALDVQPNDQVLDLCAAPGGKSLLLAQALGESGEGSLTCNELSADRRARLRGVLNSYLPASLRSRVRVAGHDGARWCLHETEAFDRILLDAPCSGERHLLNNRNEMKNWSAARSKNLAVRQYSLLSSALQVVKAGGRIVYSTCSLSQLENDDVIARLLKKREGEVEILKSQFEIGDATEHGWQILPDRGSFGPIYFSVLQKTKSKS